jgi:DNA-binding NtrC family response regulator
MDTNLCVWIADDDKSIRWLTEKTLNKAEISTQFAALIQVLRLHHYR